MVKYKITAEQHARLLEARDVMWPSVPEENVYPDLVWWSAGANRKTTCNTIACFGGWCGHRSSRLAFTLTNRDYHVSPMMNFSVFTIYSANVAASNQMLETQILTTSS
jgi:hypothetical protein